MTYQKASLHTFFCLFLNSSKAFSVSLTPSWRNDGGPYHIETSPLICRFLYDTDLRHERVSDCEFQSIWKPWTTFNPLLNTAMVTKSSGSSLKKIKRKQNFEIRKNWVYVSPRLFVRNRSEEVDVVGSIIIDKQLNMFVYDII